MCRSVQPFCFTRLCGNGKDEGLMHNEISPDGMEAVGGDFRCVVNTANYKPSFLRMFFGMAFLWMRMFMVL